MPPLNPPPTIRSAPRRFAAHVRSLSPGDRLIAAMLAGFALAALLSGALELERLFLVEVPARGGTLTEGVVGSPRFANPLLALTDADRDLAALTYAGLMGIDGDGALVPVLAEGFTVSEDGLEYAFTIRADARFSDGSPVTAEDVVFTVRRAQDPAVRSPELANWANVEVAAEGARTVRFTLPEPYAPFPYDATLGILPADRWRNIPADDFAFSPLMLEPVGAGPFRVADIERAKDGSVAAYTLEANDGFVLGRPYLDRIRFRFYPDAGSLAGAYARGRVDSAYGIPADGALRAPYARVFGAFFNQAEAPALADDALREALSRSIDRARLVTEALGGYATPLEGPLPPEDDAALPAPAGDGLARAAALLEEAGWARDPETGLWEDPDGAPFEGLTLATSNVPELRALASGIEADWERLGVPVEVALYEPGDLAAEVIRPRAYEVLLFGMVTGREQDLFPFWHSGEVEDPGLNIAGFEDEEVDALLATARTERDPALAAAARADAAARIAASYPAAFTHAPDFLYAMPISVRGVRLPQIAAPSDRFATVAAWHRYTERVWPAFANP